MPQAFSTSAMHSIAAARIPVQGILINISPALIIGERRQLSLGCIKHETPDDGALSQLKGARPEMSESGQR